MLKKFSVILLLLLMVFAVASCDSPTFREIESLELVELNTSMKDYNSPYFYGKVENTGNVDLYNAKITFTIFETSAKNNIIDTASGFPANGETIRVDQTANFEAVAFDLNSEAELEYYNVEITFLKR